MKRCLLLFLVIFGLCCEAPGQDSLIVKSIYFGGGSYYIDDGQVNSLKQFISEVERLEYYQVIIFGHTDNIGGKQYNEWLSQMRSHRVYQELVNMHVPQELIEIKNLGLTNPLYTNQTHAGRLMNRRVDVILSPLVF